MTLNLPKTNSIISKLKSSVSGKDVVAEKGWKSLIKASTQLGSLRNIVESNLSDQNSSLSQLVKSDEKVSDLVNRLSGKDLISIQEKVLSKEKISKGEMETLVNEFEDITEQMENVGLKLDVSFGSVIKDMGVLLGDSRIDRDTRRQILEDVTKLATEKSVEAKEQGQDTSSIDKNIEEIRSVMSSSLNFDDDQVDYLRGIFNELTKDQAINSKSSLALNEISNKMDSAALTSGEMKDLMKQEAEGGRSLRELLMDMPGRFSTGGMGGNILTTMLDAIAPGLTPALVMLGPALKSLVGGIGAFLGIPVFTAFKGASVMGKLGMVGKVLGKVFIVITALMAIKDFFKGFKNAAEISGKEFPSLGEKIQAGISSVLSGLSFGLLDTKKIYKSLEKFKLMIVSAWEGFKLMIKDIGILLSKAWEGFKLWMVDSFSAKGLTEAWEGLKLAYKDFGDWVVESFTSIWDKVKEVITGFKEWMFSYFENIPIFSKLFTKQVEDDTKQVEKDTKESFSISNWVKEKMGIGDTDRQSSQIIQGSINQLRRSQSPSNTGNTPIVIPQGSASQTQTKIVPTRGRFNIDDLQLALVNSSSLE